MTSKDWFAWHEPYDDPGSPLARRLAIVQRRIRDALDAVPAGPMRVVSMCAGQGRDLIGALEGHPRRFDVEARLVELDQRNVAIAREAAKEAGLDRVTIVDGDAGELDAYDGAVPADLVLVCGVFGNITDRDIEATIGQLCQVCAPGATVIWTRHRLAPDLTPAIRRWFAEAGFEEVAFDAPEDLVLSIGTHRFRGEPAAAAPGTRLFTFVGHDALRSDPWPLPPDD